MLASLERLISAVQADPIRERSHTQLGLPRSDQGTDFNGGQYLLGRSGLDIGTLGCEPAATALRPADSVRGGLQLLRRQRFSSPPKQPEPTAAIRAFVRTKMLLCVCHDTQQAQLLMDSFCSC